MLYLLAIFLPPVAVFAVGKPIQGLISILLWLFFWIPGSIHACLVVHEHKANKRMKKQAKLIADNQKHG
ncbi:Uncharacterized membrane protein YqaE, homolog of Blt101, UPF0057 family [Alteribacillus persepolensis]|uniref:Uncharacterized membrane protein YqaE, homolog of Blt101, UPF0057 family n=1 Tax=Alteribacillus persepolensis TaxID=568899 RepID=A0A1G8IBE0_9BACI|nr:YqaE/Pmp3 family membrane protein [Alteribacillus persepolensis]SDI16091.1 Uncharacterized membrane protein YqaE, homolog of Blt101, UPF0057 family [Alteribacillus persepolensis]